MVLYKPVWKRNALQMETLKVIKFKLGNSDPYIPTY